MDCGSHRKFLPPTTCGNFSCNIFSTTGYTCHTESRLVASHSLCHQGLKQSRYRSLCIQYVDVVHSDTCPLTSTRRLCCTDVRSSLLAYMVIRNLISYAVYSFRSSLKTWHKFRGESAVSCRHHHTLPRLT